MEIDDTALHSLCAQGASRPPSSGVTFDDTNRRVLLVRFLLYISCPPPPRRPTARAILEAPDMQTAVKAGQTLTHLSQLSHSFARSSLSFI